MTLGKDLKKYREEKGMTQKELSIKSGVHEVQIGRYENDKAKPSIDTLHKLQIALGLAPFDFYSDDYDYNDELFQYELDEIKKYNYSDEIKKNLIDIFDQMNITGKGKLLDHAKDLLKIEEYKEKDNKKW